MDTPSKRRRGKRAAATVFLDRDGVINVDRSDYVKSWAEFEFLPDVFEALEILKKRGLRVVVVTNQSAVNRGLIPTEMLEEIHRRMLLEVRKHGGHIEAIYYCPHTPSEHCECRKPKPGLILKSVDDLSLDLKRSYLVGDSQKDVELARSLQLKCIWISEGGRAGRPQTKSKWIAEHPLRAKSLRDAVNYILHDLQRLEHP